jgi:hypothetical protein
MLTKVVCRFLAFYKATPADYLIILALRLSAEEIKDVLCSTGAWLVVKEGFGGIGRVGRKGDGWKIRA